MTAIKIFIALGIAIGSYMLFLGIYTYVTVSLMSDRGGLLTEADRGLRSEATGLLERLDQMLYQARLQVSVNEFLSISIFLGLAAGIIMFFATGAIAAAGIGFLSGSVLYYIVLEQRRDRNLEAYEQAMPNALREMRGAFRLRGLSLTQALRQVAEHGPEVVRQDFEELTAAFSGSSIDMARIQRLLGLRGSYALDRVTEVFLQFHSTPQRVPEMLDLLIPRLRREVAVRRETRANISGPQRELLVVAVMPFALVIFFRVTAPEYGAFYSTALGQLLLIVAWIMDLAIYLFAIRAVRGVINPMPYHRDVPEQRRILPDSNLGEGTARAAPTLGPDQGASP
jgi:tight adherence protein B